VDRLHYRHLELVVVQVNYLLKVLSVEIPIETGHGILIVDLELEGERTDREVEKNLEGLRGEYHAFLYCSQACEGIN
jgi:hypothetical protein